MHPAEFHLAQLTHQIALAAMQAAVAYNQAQSNLDLSSVLEAERLLSESSRVESRRTVARLTELTRQHKLMFANFTTNATSQIMEKVGELPPEKRELLAQQFIASLNWNLAAQIKFYEGRERWIAATTEVLALAVRHEGNIWLEDGTLVFASNALLDEFSALFAVMDEIHEQEISMFEERKAHIVAAAARMKG